MLKNICYLWTNFALVRLRECYLDLQINFVVILVILLPPLLLDVKAKLRHCKEAESVGLFINTCNEKVPFKKPQISTSKMLSKQ